jgi:hypothetical protein
MVQIKINGLLEFPLQTNVFENVRNYLTGEICLAIQTTAMTVQKLINACVLCCLFEADRSVHGRKKSESSINLEGKKAEKTISISTHLKLFVMSARASETFRCSNKEIILVFRTKKKHSVIIRLLVLYSRKCRL